MNKFVVGLCTVVELAGIVGLAAIGLKRNKDCYEAEKKLLDTELNLVLKETECLIQDKIIKLQEKELEELKKSQEEGEA